LLLLPTVKGHFQNKQTAFAERPTQQDLNKEEQLLLKSDQSKYAFKKWIKSQNSSNCC
jgi:hypothetical protein